MIVMIDNYDSFTYNLVQYFEQIGGAVRVIRNDAATVEELASWSPAGIVISPGPGRPDSAGISLAAIHRFSGQIPILGRLPWPSGHRHGVWRQGGLRQKADARKDILHSCRRQNPV